MYKITLLFSLFLTSGCSNKQPDKTIATPVATVVRQVVLTDAQVKNGGVETGEPVFQPMHGTITVNGLIDVPPKNIVTISFPWGGYIKSTTLLPGMRVRKGQVLAVMEDRSIIELQEDYLKAQSRFVLLEKEFRRQESLNATKASSDKVFEQSASDFESIKISLSGLRQKLLLIGIDPIELRESSISRSVNIIAPISGFVSAVRVNTGKYVSPTDVLFDLINTSDLHLALTVFEKDIPFVLPGQQVRAYLTGDTSKIFTAEVMLVSRTLDSNRSAMVHCHFTGGNPQLMPGMYVNADIAINNISVLTVPEEALVRAGDQEFVFVERRHQTFELVPVTSSVSQNGFTAVESGKVDLRKRRIVTKNAYAVLMKLKNKAED